MTRKERKKNGQTGLRTNSVAQILDFHFDLNWMNSKREELGRNMYLPTIDATDEDEKKAFGNFVLMANSK